MLRLTKPRSLSSSQTSSGVSSVPRKRKRSVIRIVMWVMLLGVSSGILGAVWKAMPTLIWAMKQSVCSAEGRGAGGDGSEMQNSSPATNVIVATADSGFTAAGNFLGVPSLCQFIYPNDLDCESDGFVYSCISRTADNDTLVIDDVDLRARVDFINWMRSKQPQPKIKVCQFLF